MAKNRTMKKKPYISQILYGYLLSFFVRKCTFSFPHVPTVKPQTRSPKSNPVSQEKGRHRTGAVTPPSRRRTEVTQPVPILDHGPAARTLRRSSVLQITLSRGFVRHRAGSASRVFPRFSTNLTAWGQTTKLPVDTCRRCDLQCDAGNRKMLFCPPLSTCSLCFSRLVAFGYSVMVCLDSRFSRL